MIRIVYLIPYLIKSGPVNVLYNIVKNLDKREFEPIIITLHKNYLPERNNKYWFKELGIRIIEYSNSKFYVQFHLTQIAGNLVREFNDPNTIFHAHGYYPTMILSKMHNVKSISTIHNICEQDFIMQKGKLLGSYMSHCYKKALKHINVCVPISDFMKSFYNRDKSLVLHTVYNGVNDGLLYSEEKKKEIRKKMGFSSDLKLLLYPAGFSYRKNQLFIIDNVIHSTRKDFVILFAGQGSIEEECKKLANGDPRLKFLGYQMNMEPYWAICDFMISSALSEGLPMAVLEAYVRGIPCILSNIPPHKEIMKKVMGDNGLCFDIHQNNSLEFLLEEILDNNYDTDLIRSVAMKYYTSKVMSDNYSILYNSLLKQ